MMEFISIDDFLVKNNGHFEDPSKEYQRYLVQSQKLYSKFNGELKSTLRRIRKGSLGNPVTILKGVKFKESIGLTPPDSRSEKKSFETEAILGAVAYGLGTLFAYKEQSDGEIIHNICPVKSKELHQVGECSRKPLGLHIDGVSHPYPPDYLLLYCLREDEEAKTTFTYASAIFESMNADARSSMMLPRFTHRADTELEATYIPDLVGPIFSVNEKNQLIIRYDDDLTSGGNDWYEKRVQLREAIEKNKLEYVFNKYDLAIIQNRKCLHGRSRFEPQYDGIDRWLQAAYILDDERHNIHLIARSTCILSLEELS